MPNKQLKEYPLRHHHEGFFELSAEDETANTTYLPFFAVDQGQVNPELVQTRPTNDGFQKSDSWQTFPNSVINNVRLRLSIAIPTAVADGAATTVKIPAVMYKTMMVSTTFDDITTEAHESGITVGTSLLLEKEVTTENQVTPTYSGTDIIGSNLPTPTGGGFADLGLTGDMSPESV